MCSDLTDEEKEEIKRLYSEWNEACSQLAEAESQVSWLEEELDDHGIDLNDLPDWL